MENTVKTGGVSTNSEKISKKQDISVLGSLNYTHEMILSKLDEARIRLGDLTLGLGGEYSGEISLEPRYDVEDNHISAYGNLLNKTEKTVAFMFQYLERLEYLMRK